MKPLICVLVAVLLQVAAVADDDASQPATENTPATAAYVNDVAIDVSQIQRELKRSTRDRAIAAAARPAFEAAALEKLINRELTLNYLKSTEHAAKKVQIDQLWDRLNKLLATREVPIEKHLAEIGIRDVEQWRHEAAWQISWNAYRAKLVTDENLRKYFERNRRHYDGSQVRVAHILWKTKAGDAPAKRMEASEVRKRLTANEMTFAAAAKKYSQSPTADKGGDIGWIDRRKTMPETFSKAAFDLKVGEISQPVSTKFGVHLILCLEVKPGQDRWESAREQLTDDVTRWLFTWAADKAKAKAKIRYTGAAPYWKVSEDGTRQLIPARSDP